MKMIPRGTILAVLLAVVTGAPAVAAGDDMASRLYELQHLNANEASLLAFGKCLELSGPQCDYSVKGRTFFELYTDLRTHEAIRAMLQERDLPPATQVFQVTLLVAREGTAARPILPASGARALDDLESFLPYRNYTLLDAGVTRTASRAKLSLGGDPGYEAWLQFEGDPRLGMSLKVDFGLDQLVPREVRTGGDDQAPVYREDIVARDIVETSFSMEVGETVVVGTSRLNGGEDALIVLVTAAER